VWTVLTWVLVALFLLKEQWRTGKNGVTQVILAPEDQGPREREQPPDEPPLLHH
jgi:hypothetical protein